MPHPVDIARTLSGLPENALHLVVEGRLLRRPSFILPRIGSDDPSDIFIQSFKLSNGGLPRLKPVAARLVEEWRKTEFEELKKNPEPLGEAIYLSSTIGAREAILPISEVAKTDKFVEIPLVGEDLQSRAIRALAGLLIPESAADKLIYRDIFEAALNGKVHAAIGLTTLVGFWPEEESQFIDRARLHGSEQIERVIQLLGPISESFRG